MHIYNQNLMYVESNPYTLELLEQKGLVITDVCPLFQSDWWATNDFFSNPKIQDGCIVDKSVEDLKIEGIIPLEDGEVILEQKVVVIPKPNGYKIQWESPNWVEKATEEEIEEIEFNASVSFYNSELEFASKATAELLCEIITADMFEDVKLYMRAIDPYSQKQFAKISRPLLFDKYKK